MKKLIISGIVSLAAASALMAAPLSDMVIIIDESGSMQGEIATVQANAAALIAEMDAQGIEYQVSLVSFGSTSSPGPANPELLVPLTDDSAPFLAGIAGLTAVVGAGYEPGFDAVSMGMDQQNFRAEAGTCVILMTDEDSDYNAATDKAEAITAMAGQNAIFYGIVNAGSGNTMNDYGPNIGSLADVTGGTIYDINQLADPVLGAQILEDVTRACILQAVESVAFDVHPTSCPNPLNLKSGGMTPMAILGTDTFDVTTIDVSTIKVNDVPIERYALEDVATPYIGAQSDPADKNECNDDEGDGYMDLTLKIKTKDLGLSEGEHYLTVTGQLSDGTAFTGKDVVWVK